MFEIPDVMILVWVCYFLGTSDIYWGTKCSDKGFLFTWLSWFLVSKSMGVRRRAEREQSPHILDKAEPEPT